RNTLLKTAGAARRSGMAGALRTLDSWDEQLARTGAELLAERIALVAELAPLVARRYADVAAATGPEAAGVAMTYELSFDLPADDRDRDVLGAALLVEVTRRRDDELDRGVTLAGPHRDELAFVLGGMPARGYASHGEAWSLALSLRLAAYDLLRADGDDPVLVLDDVFAELDQDRRDHLAKSVAEAEQVLVTAAVAADVPESLAGARFEVQGGGVRRVH
ncbi:MAG: DNA replication and repair protein RecF, partial [Actinomycetota bacterium]|nr:DNA replication and repair protein RecF [Actinomycetota bacterium]